MIKYKTNQRVGCYRNRIWLWGRGQCQGRVMISWQRQNGLHFRKKWFLEWHFQRADWKKKTKRKSGKGSREVTLPAITKDWAPYSQTHKTERDSTLTRPSWPLCMLYGTPVHTQFPKRLRNKWKIKGNWGRVETKWRAKPVIGFPWKLQWEGRQTAAMDSIDSWCPNGPAMGLSLCFLTLTYKIILEWKNFFFF